MNTLPPAFIACLVLCAGCATEKPRGPQGTFSVKVVPFFGKDVRVYAQAFQRTDDGRGPVLASRRVTGNGVTGFVLPLDGTYAVHAYADLDGDGKQGPDDPSAKMEGLRPVGDLNMPQAPVILTLPGTGVAPDWPGNKANREGAPSANEALLRKGLEKVREAAPQIPVPPLPLPIPPPPQ